MGNYEFRKDLEEAKVVEEEAMQKVSSYFSKVTEVGLNDTHAYDIRCKVDGNYTTFEVKNELMVNKTGNVAIEYSCRGKASGIATTESDYWIDKIKGEFYILLTQELRERISKKEHDDDKSGGDWGSNTRFYLIKEAKFKNWCEKM